MVKYRWWCLSDNETTADARDVVANDALDAAEIAADTDHSNHDSDEDDWPRRYAVQPVVGDRKVQIFDVEREFDPTFNASEVRRCKSPECHRLREISGSKCTSCRRIALKEYIALRDAEKTT